MSERSHHLHFVEAGFRETELRFRDILRDNADTARQYDELKQALDVQHKDNRTAYTDAKEDFIRRILEQN